MTLAYKLAYTVSYFVRQKKLKVMLCVKMDGVCKLFANTTVVGMIDITEAIDPFTTCISEAVSQTLSLPVTVQFQFPTARWHDGKRKLSADCCGQPKLARVATASGNGDATNHSRAAIRCECELSGGGGGGGSDPVLEYLSRSRINVNVRQVFPRGLMLRPEDPA